MAFCKNCMTLSFNEFENLARLMRKYIGKDMVTNSWSEVTVTHGKGIKNYTTTIASVSYWSKGKMKTDEVGPTKTMVFESSLKTNFKWKRVGVGEVM